MKSSTYLLILSGILPYIVCDISSEDDIMFVVDCALNVRSNGTIYVSSAMTSDDLQLTALPLANVRNPVAVDYDPYEGRIYWTDYTTHSISRSYLNGSHQEILVTDLDVSTGLAINPISRTLYWTDENRKNIGKANLDGTNQTIILDHLEQRPRPIVINPKSGHIYWAEWVNEGDTGSKIQRASPDGSNVTVLIDSNLGQPNGLTLDVEGGFMYWCDAITDMIERSTLSGEDRRVILCISSRDIKPFDIFLYKGYLYLTDWTYGHIKRNTVAEQSSNTSETVGPKILNMGCGINIYIASEWETVEKASIEYELTTHDDPEYAHVYSPIDDDEDAETTTNENFMVTSYFDKSLAKLSHYIIITAMVAFSVLFVGIILLLTYYKIHSCHARFQAIYATKIRKYDGKETATDIYDTISELKQNGDYETYINKSTDATTGTQFDNAEYTDTMNRIGAKTKGEGDVDMGWEPRYLNLSGSSTVEEPNSNVVPSGDEISLLGPPKPKPPSTQKLDELIIKQDKTIQQV